MGTELMRVSMKEESDELPSVPPGFESYANFTIKRVLPGAAAADKAMESVSSVTTDQANKMEIESDELKAARSLRRRPWINYAGCDGDDAVPNNDNASSHNLDQKPSLPKGVTRGCAECNDCQKVTARWHPDEARRPDLEDAPIFYPSEEEFEDTLSYIAKIRPTAEKYGICRIVPPPSWKPPCPLKEMQVWEGSKFTTRVQRVDKLQNRSSMKKISKLSNQMRRKKRKCMKMGVDTASNGKSDPGSASTEMSQLETFGFEPGPGFTLNDFKKYADEFKAQYFKKSETSSDNVSKVGNCWEPAVEDVEGEYWRIVDKATEEIEVLYGADLETGVFGSGFPKLSSSQEASSSDEKYAKSGWNLNNFSRLPGSLLKHEGSDISGVLVPWLYIGMCFSSFCWHVEDHHLYSLNYMHWGEPKLWYGVAGKDAIKLEEAMRKHLPDLFEEQPDLLHKLVTQLSPSKLKMAGVPVHRCVQHAGEFVLTFPRAYHAGFNCGFNCAEAVNVAPVDWLPHGQIAIELYCQQGRKTSISHDKLLLGAAREVVKADWELNLLKKNTIDNLRWKEFSGKDGILAKTLKARIDIERTRREFLGSSSLALKMHSNFDATNERECCICFFDLHLSAAGCRCSPEKYSCLTHVKQLCSCPWVSKYFLFRYDIDELNVLVEAVEGKLSSVYRWARHDLGLALSAHVLERKMEIDEEEKVHKDLSPQAAAPLDKDLQIKETSREDLSKGLEKTSNLSDVNLLLKDKEQLPPSHCMKPVKEETVYNSSVPKASVCQPSEGGMLSVASAKSTKGKKNSQNVPNDMILLSDDKHDIPRKRGSVSSGKHLKIRERPTHVLALEAPGRIALPSFEKKGNSLPDTRNTISLPTNIDQRAMRGDVSSSVSHAEVNAVTDGLARDVCSRMDTSNNGGEKSKISGGLVVLDVVDGTRSNSGTPSCSQNNSPDRIIRQKKRNSLPDTPKIISLPTNDQKAMGGDVPSSIPHAEVNDVTGGLVHDTCNRVDTSNQGGGKPTSCKSKISGGLAILDGTRSNSGTPSCSQNNGTRSNSGTPSCSQNNSPDRIIRQKGPRIAKVVRRVKCRVEPLSYGCVLSGRSWCNRQAIFPKGFRSRVMYINILDPTNMSFYISEILDAGRNSPLFMVYLEGNPSEVFAHLSPTRCWEMVRDRVNQEISKQHKAGKLDLPPLQPSGSPDGFEMFGYTSPAIIQAIEALDVNRVCTEYWDSRPYSRPQVQFPANPLPREANTSIGSSLAGTNSTLKVLLKKANMEELSSLQQVLSEPNIDLVTQLVKEEIQNRR